ncbi:low-specificity L-threonine aldolase [Clostridiaceae bacterium HFYG-1003]|nr:low-specificity L-threonine aldolase [Clostridiaceae bacterium HFYG-1003]
MEEKMNFLDFRSDTVTKPTKAMYDAMLEAELGDDVYGDDPTINRLEALAAEITGMEAALFVPSGTFSNQLAIMTHISPSDEIIVGSGAHIIQHECGACARLSGAMVREVDDEMGYMKPEDIKAKLRTVEDIHYPKTGLICMETAHSNGLVAPPEIMRETWELAREHGIPVHTDGARIFNAAAYLKVDVRELTRYTDTLSFCLSKGLCAPVGSVLCGPKAFIDKARRNRKLMGGGLRQAGILAACGIVALNEMRHRLSEDHENALYLGEQLKTIEAFQVFESNIKINMVFASHNGPDDSRMDGLQDFLRERGILTNGHEHGIVRFVTHHGISREDCDTLVNALKAYFYGTDEALHF